MRWHPTSYHEYIQSKFLSVENLDKTLFLWRFKSNPIIFTNGCFDLLHDGHLDLLCKAKQLQGKLIVGVNSDASVKRLKGESRPIKNEQSRMLQLAALHMVDGVILFEEDTPLELIKTIQPDILVKGGDYTESSIVGASEVKQHGGRIEIINLVEGFSTTNLIEKMKH
ncbi:MAG: D-glycero-beta-D-manno-heptose 1-phosphate adenylyltransferase [Bacteroidota bacterium]|jgi:D-beta-D-heptose 7-phosphate kinase/D-beta-D-heptose 1-phosphate adenosyltransferase